MAKQVKWRFFYHYYKQYKRMSVHFKGKCYITDNVECNVPCETKWNKTQPNLIMVGFASSIIFNNNKTIIN